MTELTEEKLNYLRQEVEKRQNPHRFLHTKGVEKEMRYLASVFFPEREKEAAAAGILHDITKSLHFDEQFAYCQKQGIVLSDDELSAPPTLHAVTGAHYVGTHYSAYVTPEIISAIRKHTVGDTEMSVFEQALYLADYIEENRTYPECIALREYVYHNLSSDTANKEEVLYRCVIEAINNSLADLINRGNTISVKTVAARNTLLMKLSHKGKNIP